ncbi:putative sulfate/molybdate transporter [Candidatus Methanocrinis natronophilus]|uniref:Sulfate/molybdate transporter n=1 Tax=Candidatus Methanocrinis natronophilus TaxID=3033396 RepID=A0ABT5XB93_9EURY|nr:putative sulfate/molybdate transporter [Candidatus Methanocrinis natronophilus]MDF0591913.1 putative sulfate/molybdate transporter [Candidatus Methanocrinis natronophilus]
MSHPGTKGQKSPSDSVNILGEISGSVGNFGTVLPILLGAALVSEVNLGAALLFFGLWYIVMGIYYGIPISVEPMKAIGAIAIAGELTSGEIAASGLILGAALLFLGAGKGIGRLQGLIPEGVIRGVQLGLALVLIKTSAGLMVQDLLFSSVAVGVFFVFLLAKRWRSLPDVSILVVFAIGIAYGLLTRGVPDIQPISLGVLPLPDPATFIWAGWHLVLPQIPLTLTNATVAAALTAEDLYKKRIEPDRLCVTMGVMNLASVPFGGFPLCHGAGGIAAHHRFGARSRLSMAIGGAILIFIALFFAGPEALALLPIGLFGALLLFVGLELGRCGLRTDAPLLVGTMALLTLLTNLAVAFVAGLLLAMARDRIWGRERGG